MFKDKQARRDIFKIREIMASEAEKTANLLLNILKRENYAECETCGCLVRKDKAIEKDEIEYKIKSPFYLLKNELNKGEVVGEWEKEKKIKTTYTCKHCQKQNETKKRKK